MGDRGGRSGLHYAALENDVTAIQRHLAAGEDPNIADLMYMRRTHMVRHLSA